MNVMGNLFASSAGVVVSAALALALLSLVGIGWLLAGQQRLQRQHRRLLTGTSGENLEAILNDHLSRVQQVATQVEVVDRLARRLEKAAYFSLQHLGVVRFNPFSDTGGDQSFAIALVDGHGNGVVLSSLHARDVTRVYAKPLQKWESTYQLTDEEKQAIALAYKKQG